MARNPDPDDELTQDEIDQIDFAVSKGNCYPEFFSRMTSERLYELTHQHFVNSVSNRHDNDDKWELTEEERLQQGLIGPGHSYKNGKKIPKGKRVQ